MKYLILLSLLLFPAVIQSQDDNQKTIFVSEVRNISGIADYNYSVKNMDSSYIIAFRSTERYNVESASSAVKTLSGITKSLSGSSNIETVARKSGADYIAYIDLVSVKYTGDKKKKSNKVGPGDKKIIMESGIITISGSVKDLATGRIVAKTRKSINYKDQYTDDVDSTFERPELVPVDAVKQIIDDAAPEITAALLKQMPSKK